MPKPGTNHRLREPKTALAKRIEWGVKTNQRDAMKMRQEAARLRAEAEALENAASVMDGQQ